MRKLFAILLLFIFITATAQNENTDSLKQLLQKEKRDTSRAMLLPLLARTYLYSKPDTALLLCSQALSISREAKFAMGEARSLEGIADAYDILGNYPKALENYFLSLKMYETINNAKGIRRCLGNLGSVYAEQGEYRHALEYTFKAKEMAKGNENAMSIYSLNIGDDYNQLRLFDSGKIYNQQSYELATRVHNTDIIGCALTNIGETHSGMGETTTALQYLRLAITYLKEAEDDDVLCEAYLGMAALFKKTGAQDSCLYYAASAYSISKQDGFTKRMYDASIFLTGYYKDNKNIDSAFAYLQITMATKDSLFSQEKVKQIENLTFQEKLRQQEIAEEKQRAAEERKNNLQLMGISAFIVSFILLFLLVIRRKTKPRTIEFFGVVGLLLVFEFVSLFIHPFIEEWTDHTPIYMLLVSVGVAAVLVPLHHRMEKFIKEKMAHKIEHSVPVDR